LSSVQALPRSVPYDCASLRNSFNGWMDGWLGFNGILSTQVAAISCLTKFKVYYRAMHFSAKRGIAIASRLSVCDVGEL